MTVTRSFRETVQARATNDPHYRYGLLTESMDAMLSGDLETGKSLLRDYINATIGFEGLHAHAEYKWKSYSQKSVQHDQSLTREGRRVPSIFMCPF